MQARKSLTISIAVALLAPLTVIGAEGSGQEPFYELGSLLSLYLAENGAFTANPSSGGGSASFGPAAGGPLVWQVGAWKSPPFGGAFNYSGNINVTLWAKGDSALQLNTRFQVYFGVNGFQTTSTPYVTNNARLGTTAKEFKGTAAGVNLKLNAGDTIDMGVYVSERGAGGQLLYGGDYPSRIELGLQPVTMNLSVESRPGEVLFSGTITDLWGTNDILNIFVILFGPFQMPDESASGLAMWDNQTSLLKFASLDTPDRVNVEEVSPSELAFSYGWDIPSGVAEGNYLAGVVVYTASNSTPVAGAWIRLQPPKAAGLDPLVVGALAAVAIGSGGGAAAYFLFKRRKQMQQKMQSAAPASGT